ncbi:putative sulfate exporter family transporter [Pseudoalteromonas sp. Hal099]
MQSAQFSSLTIAYCVGIIVGNSVFAHIATRTDVGVDYAKSILLKAGVILFGFRITFCASSGCRLAWPINRCGNAAWYVYISSTAR